MTSIALNIDTSQAVSGFNSVTRSAENLLGKVKELERNGDYTGAANLMHKMDKTPYNSSSVQSNSTNSSVFSNFFNNNSQELKVLNNQLNSINSIIGDLTDQLEENTKSQNWKNTANISLALNNAQQEKKRVEAEIQNKSKKENVVTDNLSKFFGVKEISKALDTAFTGLNIGQNYRKDIANGNYSQAEINKNRSIGNMAGGILGSVGAAATFINPFVGAGISLLGGVVTGGTNFFANKDEADLAEADAYSRTLKSSNGFNRLFSNGGSAESNSNNAFAYRKSSVNYAMDTGLDLTSFMENATNASKYGYSANGALAMTRQASLYAQNTGSDISLIQNIMGTAKRFSGEDVSAGYLSQIRQASGLAKSQDTEFLTSLQRVISDGISDGYIKSTEDVALTFSMFNKLSNGNPLWQGEQGAKRIQQMNAGLSNASKMQSTSDMLVVSSAKEMLDGMSVKEQEELFNKMGVSRTGTFEDALMLVESGISPNLFNGIVKNVNKAEGNNLVGQIERYKQIFNVNTAGAVSIANLASKPGLSEEELKSSISNIQKDKNYISDETKNQNAINSIQSNVETIGKSQFWNNYEKVLLPLIGQSEKRIEDYEKNLNSTKSVSERVNDSIDKNASSLEFSEKAKQTLTEEKTARTLRQANSKNISKNQKQEIAKDFAVTSLQKSGDYAGVVKSILSDTGTFAENNSLSYGKNTLLGLLTSSSNEAFSNEAFNAMGELATKYSFVNSKTGKTLHKADSKVDSYEVAKMLNYSNENSDVINAFNSGNMAEFIQAFQKAIEESFTKNLNRALNTPIIIKQE